MPTFSSLIFIRWHGSVQDARVLSNSQLYQKCVDRDYLQGDSLQVNNHTIPLLFIRVYLIN